MNEHEQEQEHVDVAEEAAKEKAMEKLELTTVADMMEGYQRKTVPLKSGKVFEIESFIPGSLLMYIGAPLLQAFIEETDEDRAELLFNTNLGVVAEPIKQLVCDHIVSVSVSMQPQWRCGKNVVSIDRFTLAEIRELFKEMCALSGALDFHKAETEN